MQARHTNDKCQAGVCSSSYASRQVCYTSQHSSQHQLPSYEMRRLGRAILHRPMCFASCSRKPVRSHAPYDHTSKDAGTFSSVRSIQIHIGTIWTSLTPCLLIASTGYRPRAQDIVTERVGKMNKLRAVCTDDHSSRLPIHSDIRLTWD